MDSRTSRLCPAARQFACRTIQPSVADPHGGNHQNQQNKLGEDEHWRGLAAARKGGQETVADNRHAHRPNLAHSNRASIQSVISAITENGSRPTKGKRLRNGQRRRSAAIARSLTLSP